MDESEIKLAQLGDSLGIDNERLREIVREDLTLRGRKEGNQWLVPASSALTIAERLKASGQVANQATLVLVHERLRWIEKHDALNVLLTKSYVELERLRSEADRLQEEVKSAERRVADAEKRRGDSLENMGGKIIEKMPVANPQVLVVQAEGGNKNESKGQSDDSQHELPTPMGPIKVHKQALPWILAIVGVCIGWGLKAREAEKEIQARIDGTKQIQEQTKALAEIASTQAEEVAKQTKRAQEEQSQLDKAKSDNESKLTEANRLASEAEGRLQQLQGDSSQKTARINALDQQVAALQAKTASLESLNKDINSALLEKQRLVDGHVKLSEAQKQQLEDANKTAAALRQQLERLSGKPASGNAAKQ